MNPNDHVKEVCANFGLAVYLTQVLEQAVVDELKHIDLILKRPKSRLQKNGKRLSTTM